MKALLLLATLAACGDAHAAKPGLYGIEYDPALIEAIGTEQLDRGVTLLAERLWMSATKSFLSVKVMTVPELDQKGLDGIFFPSKWGGAMLLRWTPAMCIADSAFLHELAHAALCNEGDCDKEIDEKTGRHPRYPEVWDAVDVANNLWRAEACR